MLEYEVIDPDWENEEPIKITAESPVDAVRRYYTEQIL